jgi:quinol monooxygenase YgiN
MAGSPIRLIVHQTISPEGLGEFRRLAELGAANAQSAEPGTLGYEFFMDDSGTECYLNEYYADSKSFLTHFGNVRPILEQAMKVSDLAEVVVLGRPSPEAKAALDKIGAKYFSDCIGFCR